MEQFNKRDLINFIKDNLTIYINQKPSGYIKISLCIDGTSFSSDIISLPENKEI
jgi:hypothetical protein